MSRRWAPPLWAIPILALMAIGTVWIRLAMIRTTYEINQADQAIHSLQQVREQTELKVTGLRSPRRLEIIARSRFGLSQPRSDQVIHLQDKQDGRSVNGR